MWFNLCQLHPPCLANDWINISKEFSDLWNFPHAIAAIPAKHFPTEYPSKSRTLFYSYKSFYSIVLLVICDAKYKFILFDIGHYGSSNDCRVLNKSAMGKLLESKSLNIHEQATLEGCEYDPLPYFLLGDKAFPLRHCIHSIYTLYTHTWWDLFLANWMKMRRFSTSDSREEEES